MPDTVLTFPKVSVIVPIYNVAEHVAACIDSLRAQSLQSFEVIAIDDGSTDGSAEIARMAADGDPRFRFVHQENGGLSAARNTGLDMARAEFICFVDSDDRVAPTFLTRLLTTLQDTGADWVACGVMMCHPDGREIPHTATHSATPDGPKDQAASPPGKPGAAVRHDFTDWQEIVRHFPSAWNKMYRRSLIGDIRFDEGLYYEDHPFYYRCCTRTNHLVLLSDPLYLHTQGRDGQITRDGSNRVFEQFTVLKVMRDLMQDSAAETPETGSGTASKSTPKTGADIAFPQIATRLTFERSQAISNRATRATFLAEAREIVGGAPSDRLGVPAYWMSLLRGRLPVSVVIPSNGNVAALTQTLDSLAYQSLKEAEILVVLDDAAAGQRAAVFSAVAGFDGVSVLTGSDDPGVAGARNRGLDAARGQTLVFLDAGDTLPPEALNIWFSRMHQTGAECGFARFITGDNSDPHSGLHDHTALPDGFDAPDGFAPRARDAVFIHAHPSAKIFDRAFLNQHKLRFAPEPLSSWDMLLAVMARASRAVYLQHPPARIADRPETRQLWRAPVALDDLVRALNHMRQRAESDPDWGNELDTDLDIGALTPPDYTRLFVRAIWEKINFADFPDEATRQAFQVAARQHCKTLPPPHAPLDPYIDARLRSILGLPIAEA